MKTTLEYLEDRKNMACHNLLCCSANYIMTKPKEGMEEGFVEYTRDCEIIDELIAMVKERSDTDKLCPVQNIPCIHGETAEDIEATYVTNCSINVDFSKLREIPLLARLLRELEDYANANGLSINEEVPAQQAPSLEITIEEAAKLIHSIFKAINKRPL